MAPVFFGSECSCAALTFPRYKTGNCIEKKVVYTGKSLRIVAS